MILIRLVPNFIIIISVASFIFYIILLQTMQLEVDSLQMELKKKDTVIAVCSTEKDRTFERLKDEEGTYYLVYGT